MEATLAGTRVLVTGATGFIGSHLCVALANTGAQVIALRRPGSSPRWPESLDGRVEWVEADLRDVARLTEAVRAARATRVFHLAAATTVERGFQIVAEMIATNLVGTINLLRALDGTGYECFIQTGSAEEYGAGDPPFQESASLRPVSPYSASKAAATLFCEMYHRTLNCPIIILRPFLVYGPGQSPTKLIPQAIFAALANRDLPMTSGQQTREFTYIDDVIDGYLRAAVTPGAIGQTINLGTGVAYKIVDVVRLIIELTGSTMTPRVGALPDRPGEIWAYQGDHTKAQTVLGWTPAVPLPDGLRRTIAWYRLAVEQGQVTP
ncbi:MAG: SDR family NAD(P)-dependent oxidoreductase [Candidatus Latescibacteria bacterium]|nr:SDR family NAD(P)-dependent oxidoreductase [Candidatus Latescibacterota bacterium]